MCAHKTIKKYGMLLMATMPFLLLDIHEPNNKKGIVADGNNAFLVVGFMYI